MHPHLFNFPHFSRKITKFQFSLQGQDDFSLPLGLFPEIRISDLQLMLWRMEHDMSCHVTTLQNYPNNNTAHAPVVNSQFPSALPSSMHALRIIAEMHTCVYI